MNDPRPPRLCIALGTEPPAYWHADVLGHTDDGHPLVVNDGGLLDVTTLGLPFLQYEPLPGYDEHTTRRDAQALLRHLIATEGSPT